VDAVKAIGRNNFFGKKVFSQKKIVCLQGKEIILQYIILTLYNKYL